MTKRGPMQLRPVFMQLLNDSAAGREPRIDTLAKGEAHLRHVHTVQSLCGNLKLKRQRLKPGSFQSSYGTVETVPYKDFVVLSTDSSGREK